MKAAFTTLLTKESYLPGTLVLFYSWQAIGSKYGFVVMVTPELSQRAKSLLHRLNITVREVDALRPLDDAHQLDVHDERFADTWTKLRAFELVEYDRVALLDSDILILQNMDGLMEEELPGKDWIAACHACACNPRKLPHYPADWVPQNCAYTPLTTINDRAPSPVFPKPDSPRTHGLLNSGVVLLYPSMEIAGGLHDFLYKSPLVSKFLFPDQDLLAYFFAGRWKPLSYVYNALKTLRIIHPSLWRDEHIKCVHYILPDKPWMQRKGAAGEYEVMNHWWWIRYEELSKKLLEQDLDGFILLQEHVVK